MLSHTYRYHIRGPCVAITCALALVSGSASALPVFPMPGFPGAGHPPGFITHIDSGVGFLVPGGALPAIPFGDALVSPNIWHWEVEIGNPGPVPLTFNVTLAPPPGTIAPITGGVVLVPGASIYFDVHLPDIPEVGPVGTWAMTAVAAAGMPGPVTAHATVIEYPPPAIPDLIGLSAVIGAPFVPPFPGAPTVTIGIVPAPGALALLGVAGLVGAARRRRPS